MKKIALSIIAVALSTLSALAQPAGQLAPGQVWGNSTAARAPASPATLTALIDRAISLTQGSMLYRNATVWTSLPPGTAGLPILSGGAGANLSYGILSLAAGGTNANLTASNGGIFYSTGSAGAILAGTATAGQLLQSGASSAPSWSAATFQSAAGSTGTILRSSGTGWVATTATYPATTSAGSVVVSATANTVSATPTPVLGVAGSTVGTIGFQNATSGTLTISPPTGALGSNTLSLPIATDTLIGKATTDTLTNKTYNTAGAGNVLQINSNTVNAVTGTGSTVALSTSPSFTTPTLGVATATSINKVALTAPATAATLTIANNKTLTVNNSLTFSGTDATTMTFPASSAAMAALDLASQSITGGATVSSLGLSTGSFTVDCGSRPIQTITNGGAFTITAPSTDGYCLIKTTNNASAGAITFSGFSVGTSTGDALTTTNGHKFIISVIRAGGDSTYQIKALQ